MQRARLYVSGEGIEERNFEMLQGHSLMCTRIIKTESDTNEARALAISYYEVEGKEPGDLKTVEAWALRKRIVVEAVWEEIDPFNLGVMKGS
jgi:hypothetical protein